ncbi:hypothetical protein [Kitasatospora sp. NPDC002965]|uniref:hypothetical protein n=1 Tax=Kitasatospora sp. NPDC002965 TaxID=3154775 RepID=UPI0033BD06B0
MSQRSTQAFNLGRHLSEKTDVPVELRHESGARWLVQWPDGPTRDQMRALVTEMLEKHPYHFGLMKSREISFSRMDTTRAWAARAVAARRDGSLAAETARGAARRRELGIDRIRVGITEPKAAEYYVLVNFIEQQIDDTAYPDRPSDPTDAPLIEELLTAGRRSEYAMANILTNELLVPEND